ncbi:EthD family reductase [Chitinophaga sp. SYP-B3965]|uniref:EthD family reductase n=1 Tax=Chitinophaga sp. SYP-B3965 TaxID=2663120 RepID=UPI001299B2D2|nr:EthD family reductase [Chitinophaga sp. SYP-B3965]MRG45282.1 EthD family reductase [Chitinophaga sp. SYP-B3965]
MKTRSILTLLFFVLSFSSLKAQPTDTFKVKKGMIKVTILYPNGEGKTFDMDYYTKKHMPLVASFMGDGLKHIAIDKGIASGMPDTPVPFLAIGYLYFDKLSDYEKGLAPHVEEIRADFPKYTNIRPVIQISEVLQ